MAVPRVLLLVLAGGAGGRLSPLTEGRAKPAVPWGGSYRLVDVVLSNAVHSGVPDVWVVEQFSPATLSDHLANGRPWDLDRTSQGGLLVLHPHQGGQRGGWHKGTADALWRTAGMVRDHDPEVLVVVSADAVYRCDYLDVAQAHRDSGRAVTAVTTSAPAGDDVSRYGVVQVEGDRVVDYAYKPEDPEGNTITTEIFALSPRPVLDRLDALAEEAGDDGLEDLGDALLPALVEDRELAAQHLSGWWRDVGTVSAYWTSHQELVSDEPPFRPDDPAWPLLTRRTAHGPARVLDGAGVRRSLLSPGAVVAGTVERSVLGPGAVVEEGARVEGSVLLPGAVVRAGARVCDAVLDDGAEVVAGAEVLGNGPDDVAVVPRHATVEGRVDAQDEGDGGDDDGRGGGRR